MKRLFPSLALLFFACVAGGLFAAPPQWWTNRGAVDPNATPDDYAAVTQGQLKHFTQKAVQEMNTNLSGGAGFQLNYLVETWKQEYRLNDWNDTDPKPEDFVAMNAGQLKFIANKIWLRLIETGYSGSPPSWLAANPATDSQIVNIGQLKTGFDFDLGGPTSGDQNGNGIPDWWEDEYFPEGDIPTDPQDFQDWLNSDPTNSGLTIAEKISYGLDPTKASTNDIDIPDGWLVGHGINPRTADPYSDDDEGVGDGLPLYVEFEVGTNPNKRDTDGDQVYDGNDAVPTKKEMTVRAVPESNYAIIDLGSGYPDIGDSAGSGLNDKGEVLLTKVFGTVGGYITYDGELWRSGEKIPIGKSRKFSGPLQDGSVYFDDPKQSEDIVIDWAEGTVNRFVLKRWTDAGTNDVGFQSIYVDVKSNEHFNFPMASNYLNGNIAQAAYQAEATMEMIFRSYVDIPPVWEFWEYQSVWYLTVNDAEDISVGISLSMWDMGGPIEAFHRAMGVLSSTGEWRELAKNHEVLHWQSGLIEEIDGTYAWKILTNNDGFIVGVISDEYNSDPSVFGWENDKLSVRSGSGWQEVSDEPGRVDLNESITPEGPYFYESKEGSTTLWCNNNGNFVGIELSVVPIGSTNVVGRTISNHLVIPGGEYIWRNSRMRRVADLCGNPTEWSNFNIRLVSPNNNLLLGDATRNGTNHRVLLIPVEVYDDALNSPTVAWNGQMLNLAQVQSIPTIINPAFIRDNGIAWIKAHADENNDAPEMPRLVARAPIPGASNLTYKWRLEVKYERPNGRAVAEDTVKIPSDGGWEEVPADQEWRIFEEEDWENEINQKGFFGGTAKLFLWTPGEGQPSKPIYEFKIGGKNPDPERAKDHIDEKADEAASDEAGNQSLPVGTGLWYAYAIAKHEAGSYNGGEIRYNQFWERKGKFAGVDHFAGEVLWVNNPGEPPPKGFGLFQVTGNKDDQTADIPRRELWNWQENVKAGLKIIAHKKYGPSDTQHAVKWIQRQQNAQNANGTPLPPLTVAGVTFTESGPRQIVDAVAIKAYNGAARVIPNAESGTHQGYILNTADSGQFCYWRNASNAWALSRLRPADLKNYVQLVCDQVE